MGGEETAVVYTTLEAAGEASYEEKKSLFLGHAISVKTEEEAQAFIKARQKEFYDATHNVWAYRLGQDAVARYSDDGEPQGSSGLPTLETIRKSGVTDAVVVITRYFGGTLLGVGGLVRAYSHTAKLAMEAAHIITYEKYALLTVCATYADYQRLMPLWPRFGVLTDAQDFAERVTLCLAVKDTLVRDLMEQVREATGGRCQTEITGARFDYR